MKLLFSSSSPPEVGLLKTMLDDAGIANEMRNETIYPNLPGAAFQPEIWVLKDEDFKAACELRDDWQRSQPTRSNNDDVTFRRPVDRSGTIGAIIGALLFLAWALLAQKKYAQSSKVEYQLGALLLGAIAAGLIWLAIIVWPGKRGK